MLKFLFSQKYYVLYSDEIFGTAKIELSLFSRQYLDRVIPELSL